jgi:hypothetical protein
MKSLPCMVCCILFLALSPGLAAQVPDWLWAVPAGGSSSDYGNDIAVDPQGNLYVTGSFGGTSTFGTNTLTSTGGNDLFVAKLDGGGNWLWAIQASSSTMAVEGTGIVLGQDSNLYVTGYFGGTASFDGISLPSEGQTDAFVAKLDADGNWLWAIGAGGSSQDQGIDLALDPSGNVFIAGTFAGNASFGPTSITSQGSSDVFVAKLDSAGNWLWAQGAGGSYIETLGGITVCSGGNAYLTGYFSESAEFGAATLTSSGSADVYVASVSGTGVWLWAKKAGGSADDIGCSIVLDPSFNLLVTGEFGGTGLFGTTSLTSAGNQDVFVAKLDIQGNWIWAQRGGGSSNETGWDLATDAGGNVYLAGYFTGTSLIGSTTLVSSGYLDILAAALDGGGNWLWALKAGGTNGDYGFGISTDGTGAYLTGRIYGSATFGDIGVSMPSGPNVFVAKVGSGTGTDDALAPGLSLRSVLEAPLPNPFRRGETVRLTARIAQGEEGLLTVCNLRGQVLREFSLGPGAQEVRLESGTLSSGIYLCKLRTRSGTQVRKLVLLN